VTCFAHGMGMGPINQKHQINHQNLITINHQIQQKGLPTNSPAM